MKDGFEVVCEGLKPTDRFLHLRRYYVRFLHCRQISATIICKFESNKQTKHNLFLAHSQISLLHRFHRLHFPQSAISFPGKIKQNWKESETIPCNGRIWNFYVCMEPVFLYLPKDKDSCQVDTSLPLISSHLLLINVL